MQEPLARARREAGSGAGLFGSDDPEPIGGTGCRCGSFAPPGTAGVALLLLLAAAPLLRRRR